jgi:hypothetical protein
VPNATIQPAGIVVSGNIFPATLGAQPRALYLYENPGIQSVTAAVGSNARSLYLYENDGVQVLSVLARSCYLYENDAIQALAVLLRCLYGYEATRDLPVQPWLNLLDPAEQYPLGAVDIYGDGLGQFVEVAAGSTITASSTNGTHIPSNVVVRTSATSYWQSNDTTTAWIRFTFGAPLTIYGVALEDIPNNAGGWGTPLFRFSDGGADVTGAVAVPVPGSTARSTQYPVGMVRAAYILPTERTGITWMEVRVASGGSGLRGLSQAWVLADEGQNAETSVALLNALSMGATGPWLNRSPNLWPANSGVPLAKAVTVVVPSNGVSGLVKVQES